MRIANKNCEAAVEDLNHMTYGEVSAKYGVSKTTLLRWRNKAKKQAEESMMQPSSDSSDEMQIDEKVQENPIVDLTDVRDQSDLPEDHPQKKSQKSGTAFSDAALGTNELTPYPEGDDDEVMELVMILAKQVEKLKIENRQLRRSLMILME